MTSAIEGFQPVAEVTADERGRVPIGRAGAREHERYAVSKNIDGAILLTPLASIPKRELLVWRTTSCAHRCSGAWPRLPKAGPSAWTG